MIDLSENETKYTVSMGPYHQPAFGSNANFSFFGDESFLVSACSSSFQAWSFDKATKMTREMDGYARHRRIRMHERLERQRARDVEMMARVLRQEEVNLEITGSVGKYHAFQRTEN